MLLADVKAQGKKGDIIDVSDGYARNFLLPKKLATIADTAALNEIKNKKEAAEHRAREEKRAANELAERLHGLTIYIEVNVGQDGKLYGSVTNQHVCEQLLKLHALDVDKRKVSFREPIHSCGTYVCDVKLHPEVTETINVVVKPNEK